MAKKKKKDKKKNCQIPKEPVGRMGSPKTGRTRNTNAPRFFPPTRV